MMTAATVALTRFGLSARRDDAPPTDPRRWSVDQLDRYRPAPSAIAAAPTSADAAARLVAL